MEQEESLLAKGEDTMENMETLQIAILTWPMQEDS